jgi:hypothetical protein
MSELFLLSERQIYVVCGNAAATHRSAYDVGPETKPDMAWSKASRILADLKDHTRVISCRTRRVSAPWSRWRSLPPNLRKRVCCRIGHYGHGKAARPRH